MLVSFDFDSTLKTMMGAANTKICNALRSHKENGDNLFIITSRENTKDNAAQIFAFLAVHKLFVPSWNIFLEDSDDGKIERIIQKRIDIHYDDAEWVLAALESTNTIGVNAYTRKAREDFDLWMSQQ